MRGKYLLCVILALLLVLPPWTLASASGGFSQADLELIGEMALPEASDILTSQPVISVRVPNSGWVVVNPYRLEVARDGVVSSEQIVSPVLTLENQSEIPVRVDACAVGQVASGSSAVFVPAPPAPDAQEKEVFMFLEFQPFQGWETVWSGGFTDSSNQLAVSAAGEEKRGVLLLDVGGQGAFRAFGEVNTTPGEAWNSMDAVGVSLLFTFSPAEEQPSEPLLSATPEAPPESVDGTGAADDSTVEPPGTPPPLSADPEPPAESEPPADQEPPVEPKNPSEPEDEIV